MEIVFLTKKYMHYMHFGRKANIWIDGGIMHD